MLEEILEEIIESIFGIKEHEFVMRRGSIQIGSGVIQLWEQTMPLDAVSLLEVTQLAPKPYLKPMIAFIISVLLIFMLPNIRGFFIVTGIIAIAVMIGYHLWNESRPYFLDIYNHMGYRLRLEHWSKSSLIELKEQIEKCISNKGIDLAIELSGEKIDMSGSKFMGDVIMGGDKYQVGGDMITGNGIKNDSGIVQSGIRNMGVLGSGTLDGNIDMSISSQVGISDEEWKAIMEYAALRKNDYPEGSRSYAICHNMQCYALKKDVNKFTDMIKRVGKGAMDSVLATCTSEVVKNIVARIFLGIK